MSWDKRRTGLATGLVVLLAVLIASRLHHPHPPAHAVARPKPPAEFVHPIFASAPVVHSAPPACRGRDLHDVARLLRRLGKDTAGAVKTTAAADGAPAACRAEPQNRKSAALLDVLTRDASGCVARDSELDSQWNMVQSALVALDACADCTHPRGARLTSCQRVTELCDAADKATP